MDQDSYPYIPKHVVLRRYDEIDVLNLETTEDYTIDQEAYDLLEKVNGKTSIHDILSSFSEKEGKEALEALEFFADEGIIKLSQSEMPEKYQAHLDLPDRNPFEPPFLKFLMINITEKCNLTCKHCYITDKNQIDFPLDKLEELIIDFYRLQGEKIIFTGGEPFLYKNFKELLLFLKDIPLKKVLLTNGVLIEEKKELLPLIKDNNFEVFVSIDGLEDTHNDFRNAECFGSSILGIKLLLEAGIITSINTMVHKQNLEEFDELSKYLKSLGSIKTWTVEVPTFEDSTPQEIIEKYDITPKEGGVIMRDYWWGETYDAGVSFQGESSEEGSVEEDSGDHGEEPMGYACGPFMMAVDVLGEVSKCGFFTERGPGNVLELGLKDSWKGVQKSCVWDVQDLKCNELNCDALDECRGGCRYRAQKHTDDLYGIDPYKCIAYNKKLKS